MGKRISLTLMGSEVVRPALSLVVLLAGCLASPVLVAAEAAPFCASGQTPRFVFGFAELKAAVGDLMGDPLECEHVDLATGDSLQQTTSGLAMYHQSTNSPEFTDGWNHWALEPDGIVAWSGASQPVRGSSSAEPGHPRG